MTVVVVGEAYVLCPKALAFEIKGGHVSVCKDDVHPPPVGGGSRDREIAVFHYLGKLFVSSWDFAQVLSPHELSGIRVETVNFALFFVCAGEEQAVTPDYW